MKLRYLNTIVILSSALALTACFNSSSSDKKTDAAVNEATSIADKSADTDPTAIFDPSALTSDITSLFGSADSDPIDVKDSDTVKSVINRLN